MGFSSEVRYFAGIAIYDLTGRLVSGPDSDSLQDILTTAVDRGHPYILLNCAGVTYVDSAGVAKLVSGYAALAKRGGAMRLLNPSKRLVDILVITGVDGLFEIDTDEATALSQFRTAGNWKSQRRLASYLSGERTSLH